MPTKKDGTLGNFLKVVLILALVAFFAPTLLRRATSFIAVDLMM